MKIAGFLHGALLAALSLVQAALPDSRQAFSRERRRFTARRPMKLRIPSSAAIPVSRKTMTRTRWVRTIHPRSLLMLFKLEIHHAIGMGHHETYRGGTWREAAMIGGTWDRLDLDLIPRPPVLHPRIGHSSAGADRERPVSRNRCRSRREAAVCRSCRPGQTVPLARRFPE